LGLAVHQRAFRMNTMYRVIGKAHKESIKEEKPLLTAECDNFSETSTACSSEDDIQELEPLLWVSEIKFAGESTRQFNVSIGRSSAHQRFGLTFVGKGDGRIVIAEDAMHLGIAKGDLLLSINGYKDLTQEKCSSILKSALRIDFSLLRIDHAAHCNAKHIHRPINKQTKRSHRHGMNGMKCVDLLAASPAVPDGAQEHFTVRMSRASREQKFGLSFRSINNDVTGKNLSSEIYIAEDLPHLGLMQGDCILEVNGCRIRNCSDFQRSLDACLALNLVLKRQSDVPTKKTSLL